MFSFVCFTALNWPESRVEETGTVYKIKLKTGGPFAHRWNVRTGSKMQEKGGCQTEKKLYSHFRM